MSTHTIGPAPHRVRRGHRLTMPCIVAPSAHDTYIIVQCVRRKRTMLKPIQLLLIALCLHPRTRHWAIHQHPTINPGRMWWQCCKKLPGHSKRSGCCFDKHGYKDACLPNSKRRRMRCRRTLPHPAALQQLLGKWLAGVAVARDCLLALSPRLLSAA